MCFKTSQKQYPYIYVAKKTTKKTMTKNLVIKTLTWNLQMYSFINC